MVLTEAQLQEIAKRVRSIIRAESKGVGELPIASTLDGILSLPALRMNGGVPEVVEAPISKLQDVATDMVKDATKKATGAATSANNAATGANNAKTGADNAAKAANAAAGSVNEAKTAANNAAKSANDAAGAATTAKQNADKATQDANAATKSAIDATGEATKATGAAKVATESALNGASNATSAASKATSAADTANKEAALVNAAKTEALAAASRANTTATTAEAEIEKMKQLQQSISGSASLSPTKMELTYLKEMSIRNTFPQKIGVRLLPSYSLQNVLFLSAGGDAVEVDPSGSLKVVHTGESQIHVIPTGATHLYQTVRITVRQPNVRLCSGGLRLTSNGTIRLI